MFKLTECVIVDLLSHLSSHNLMSKFQFKYRKFHLYETALLRIQNDIFILLDAGRSTAQLLLDQSAALNTINQSIYHRLQLWFGVSSTAFNLLSPFFSDRSQMVVVSNLKPKPNSL